MVGQQVAQNACRSAVMTPHPGHRGGSAKSRIGRKIAESEVDEPIALLVAQGALPHKREVTAPFDTELRRLRRDRAARRGIETFLLDRAFEDCLDRLAIVRRPFASALLLGCPNPAWPEALRKICGDVDIFEPGPLMAKRAGGSVADEGALPIEAEGYDLVIAVGTLDTANDLDEALLRLRFALKPDGFLLGAMSGGETLPCLRSAMRAADSAVGHASPHVHPRVSPAALSQLLTSAGLAMPVVDVDRVKVSYGSLSSLIRDLRAMAATNILVERSKRWITRTAFEAASTAFRECATSDRTVETFEILHFAAWAPSSGDNVSPL